MRVIKAINDFLFYMHQLPQNLLGLVLLLFYKHEKRENRGIEYYYCPSFPGGISLGRYILVGSDSELTVRHEYGHCMQSEFLGWFYLLVIGLPSIIWAGLYGPVIPYTKNGYYRFYTEKWADKLAEIKRD